LRQSYEDTAFAPIWVDDGGINARGRELLKSVAKADDDGLTAADYLAGLPQDLSTLSGDEALAGLELVLSDIMLKFGRDLYAGRTTPAVTSPDIVIARKRFDPGIWLAAARQDGAKKLFSTLRPAHPQYAQLRQLLAGYRSLAARGGWPKVSKGDVLKPGMSAPRVLELRANLVDRGYSGLDVAEPEVFDDGLKSVITHMQRRHGLGADGVVGPATLRAMNVSAEQRVAQLIINLERWRWLPRSLGARHILVNQAGFEMFLMQGRKLVDRRRVIIGKPFHKTPMFSDEIIYAEFNPTWTVPSSIAGNEMLPKLKKNPGYLASKGYKLYTSWKAGAPAMNAWTIDWYAVNPKRFPYRIVQGPGPKNALGQVKFIFPNKFNVYLHDTPSRQLFARTGRAFSHGCIRVHKPLEFAKKLFQQTGRKGKTSIKSILASKKQTRVKLKTKMPVHLAYFTTWVDDNGVPLFFNDVYGRDKLVGSLLFGEI
jgi:murein L,D-transpeptidase YcbB/YkuD